MTISWVPVFGEARATGTEVTFNGVERDEGQAAAAVVMSDQQFAGGRVNAEVTFREVSPSSVCEIVLWYDPATRNMLTAGLGGAGYMFAVRFYNDVVLAESKWTVYAGGGRSESLEAGRSYRVVAEMRGSRVTLLVDGVTVLSVSLAQPLSPSQAGLFCLGKADCTIRRFSVEAIRGRAFVVMQFGGIYDELYEEVIRPACVASQIDVVRADETMGPGLIIADIVASIEDAKLVIAEVTPANPNVFFEVGYSYAVRKPTILLAEKGTRLPFDVSPFRTLFYENSIKGKKLVEHGLREHILAALGRLDGA
jgi:hypothetical protein